MRTFEAKFIVRWRDRFLTPQSSISVRVRAEDESQALAAAEAAFEEYYSAQERQYFVVDSIEEVS